MKTLLLILFVALNFAVFGQAVNYRNFFHENMFSEAGLEKIIDRKTSNSIEYAYEGLACTMMAKYYVLPTSKLTTFNKGKAMIDKSIKNHPEIVELRYIRLLVQLNAPSFLGYNKSIDGDYKYFVSNLKSSNISVYWKKKIVNNIWHTENIGEKRKQELIDLRNTL